MRQDSADLLALVEEVRRTARTDPGATSDLLRAVELPVAIRLARAFSTYFHLANVTEQVHRSRVQRDVRRTAGDPLNAAARRIEAALASGESLDPGEAGSSESRDFLTAVRALLPDPKASHLVTHERCDEDDDYAFYSAIDLLGLSTMLGLFSAPADERPRVAWWSQYTTDAAHHHGGPRSPIAVA